MVIVDDHIAVLAIAGAPPGDLPAGPVVTTYSFHFRLARAVADEVADGQLSRHLDDPAKALRRMLRPPSDRLVVLDPRASLEDAVDVGARYRASLLLAELVGAARYHRAAVRVSRANVGRSWPDIMASESVDFATLRVS
jgi:hypothetical protein